jgi:hypothetical protein
LCKMYELGTFRFVAYIWLDLALWMMMLFLDILGRGGEFGAKIPDHTLFERRGEDVSEIRTASGHSLILNQTTARGAGHNEIMFLWILFVLVIALCRL